MNSSSKGGRPIKGYSEKRTRQVNFKLSIEEHLLLKNKARQSGLVINDFVRKCISNCTVLQRLTVDQLEYLKQLMGMANNINQITRKANTHGFEPVIEEYLYLANRIDSLIKHIQHDGKNN